MIREQCLARSSSFLLSSCSYSIESPIASISLTVDSYFVPPNKLYRLCKLTSYITSFLMRERSRLIESASSLNSRSCFSLSERRLDKKVMAILIATINTIVITSCDVVIVFFRGHDRNRTYTVFLPREPKSRAAAWLRHMPKFLFVEREGVEPPKQKAEIYSLLSDRWTYTPNIQSPLIAVNITSNLIMQILCQYKRR